MYKFITLFPILILLKSTPCSANLNYFDKKIDFWNNQEATKENIVKKEVKAKSKNKFQWEKYHNPNNKEFWKEGNYETPKPVAEAARVIFDKASTSADKKEAVENYKKWVELKNKLHRGFARELAKYSKDYTNKLPPQSREYLKNKALSLTPASIDNKEISFTMYFRSTCPHCHNMLKTFNDLHSKGFYVEAKQIDKGNLKKWNHPFAVMPAPINEIKKLSQSGITGVPFTLIYIGKEKVVPVQGYKTTNQLFALIKQSLTK